MLYFRVKTGLSDIVVFKSSNIQSISVVVAGEVQDDIVKSLDVTRKEAHFLEPWARGT